MFKVFLKMGLRRKVSRRSACRQDVKVPQALSVTFTAPYTPWESTSSAKLIER